MDVDRVTDAIREALGQLADEGQLDESSREVLRKHQDAEAVVRRLREANS